MFDKDKFKQLVQYHAAFGGKVVLDWQDAQMILGALEDALIEIDELEADCEHLQGQEYQLEDAQDRIEELEEEVEEAVRDRENDEYALEDAQDRVAELEKEVAGLNKEVEKLNRDLKDAHSCGECGGSLKIELCDDCFHTGGR